MEYIKTAKPNNNDSQRHPNYTRAAERQLTLYLLCSSEQRKFLAAAERVPTAGKLKPEARRRD